MTITWCRVRETWSVTNRIFSHFGLFFALLPPDNPKNLNFGEKKKIPWSIILLHMWTINHDHIIHCSWDMMRGRCNSYFLFWAIFSSFTPLTTQKIKILKKWKNPPEISSFYTCVPKIMITWCMVPEIWCAMDKQTKNWHIEVGAPPNKI